MAEKKRGQSAMEFLMTYGWAILVIVIVIAVLFYMGVMNPKNMQTDSCVLAPGFSCYNFKVAGPHATLYLDLGQATGGGIVVTEIECTENLTPTLTNLTNPVYVASGEHSYIAGGDSGNIVNCTDAGGNQINAVAGESDKFQGRIGIGYTSLSDNSSHSVFGDTRATIGSDAPIIGGSGCAPNCGGGSGCTLNSQCASGYCTGGVCENCTSNCPIGASCTENGTCASGYCAGGVCTTCTSNCADGVTCTDSAQCISGFCQGTPLGELGCTDLITTSATCRSTRDSDGMTPKYCCCDGDPLCVGGCGVQIGYCDGGVYCNSPTQCYTSCCGMTNQFDCAAAHTVAGDHYCQWITVYPTPIPLTQGTCSSASHKLCAGYGGH